jgi:biotin carboxyl carrier protein
VKFRVVVEGRELEVVVSGNQVTVNGESHEAALEPVPGTPLSVLLLDGRTTTLVLERGERGQWTVLRGGRRLETEVLDERTAHIRSLSGPGSGPAAGGALKAPMPGLVVRVQVEAGQEVVAGAPLVVLEAMKMENQLKAPGPGRVSEVRVAAGQVVEKGQVLIRLEAEG